MTAAVEIDPHRRRNPLQSRGKYRVFGGLQYIRDSAQMARISTWRGSL
jgi:hypothetical protein